ncbi:hypothetical protein [Nocardioides marmorisolisilvae]|uniref:PH domain-containing protein n=1 Tax=Nocardioides marmorisolisilvae TaxID=1542737 RepID=A0A3N0DT50_9ACTN|nr:hypothetical protein [Nocardioides marmorisolisilvae]RNL78583.1 hypothetical protein EFL95_05700 [Nocardioides marmorisolisilvae]
MAVTITEQKYGPTTGAFTGWVGLVLCLGSIAALLTGGPTHATLRFALVLGVVALLVWCFVLRPRVIVREPNTLLLRNAVSTWELPLAAITRVGVKAITRVHLGDTPYDGIGVGRRVRNMVRGQVIKRGDGFADAGRALGDPPRRERKHPSANSPEAIADLVTEQVLAAAERARDAGQPTDPVRRSWAWPELVLFAAVAIGFAVTYVV